MEGISAITSRILAIQSQITSLAAPRGAQASAAMASTSTSATEFSRSLTAAMSHQSATLATGVAAPGVGKSLVDAKGVPTEFKQYGNGTIPAEALSNIADAGNHSLWAPAARSFEALRAAAAVDGVTIGITDSYRTYDAQVDLVAEKGLYSQGGLAATPGTSNHGWGTAVDLRLDDKAQAWMRTNASGYGFVEDVPREPWHWHYVPTR